MTLEKMQKNSSKESEKQQKIKFNINSLSKFTNKEALAVAIAAMDANEINWRGRIEEKGRADANEKYIQELLGVIHEQQQNINNLKPEDETLEDFNNKLKNFMKSEDPKFREIEDNLIQDIMKKQDDIIRTKYNYEKIISPCNY
jgi:hypothetical protein